jgi:hypothetical protein
MNALIDSLLDCFPITSCFSPIQPLKSLSLWLGAHAEGEGICREMYAHTPISLLDVMFGMDRGTYLFISHQRNIREALRHGTRRLQDCSAAHNNETLFSRGV